MPAKKRQTVEVSTIFQTKKERKKERNQERKKTKSVLEFNLRPY